MLTIPNGSVSLLLVFYFRYVCLFSKVIINKKILYCRLVCRDYVIKKSTGDASVLTFIAGFISSTIWLKYGLLTNERSLVIVNSIGVALMLAYTVVFYLFTTRRRDTIRISSISFIFLCLVLIYASIEEDHLQATERIGFIGIGVSLVFFASPLANLAHVVRVKNSESLPFSMIVSSFVVTLLWFIYGNLIGDYFIQGMFSSAFINHF